MVTKTRTIKGNSFSRTALFERQSINEDARTVELAFSSEEPVERWFGYEVLDHSPSSVRLGRLSNGGPLLVDHDHRDHVGVIESVSIDSDRRGRATVRFGKGDRASEIFQDVVDGIRTSVSVGYRINEALLEKTSDNGPDTYRVTDWEPYEVSIVSVPADATVGVGRSTNNSDDGEFVVTYTEESREMPEEKKTTTPAEPKVDVAAEREAARAAEQARVREIMTIGEKHNVGDLARQFIENGKGADEFRMAVLDQIGVRTVEAEAPEIGMSEREAEQFSFVRALNALANPTDRRAQEAAAFEFEASAAAAEKTGKDVRGLLVPIDVLKRELNVGTPTAGGNTVATDLLSGNFIDMLRNRAVMMNIATTMTDLNGNIAIPRQTGGATGYWVAEGGAPTESQQTIDQVAMTPKILGAFTEYTRKLLLQSSIDVEAFVRADLATVLALEIDRAAINGSGASNQPTGILNTTGIGAVVGGANGAAPTWDHIVDLESEVAIDNADVGNLRYLTNAVVRGKAKKTFIDAGSGERLWDSRAGNTPLNGYEAIITNQVPSNLDKGTSVGVCSAIIFGNFADLIIGMWGGLDIQVNPYALDTSGGVRVTALQDVDIAVRHPESFAAMTDALTA